MLGKSPKTRNVAVWVLKHSGPWGFVEDPPKIADSVDLKFDLPIALKQAYRFFLQPDLVGHGEDRDDGYIAFELSKDRVASIDARLLNLLRADAAPEDVLRYLGELKARFSEGDADGRSIGPEGVMIKAI